MISESSPSPIPFREINPLFFFTEAQSSGEEILRRKEHCEFKALRCKAWQVQEAQLMKVGKKRAEGDSDAGQDHEAFQASVRFWEFPTRLAALRQIFPDAGVRCPARPLGGAARGAERGKRGRAGRLSSHARAAAAGPASAAAAHLAPPAGRSRGGRAGGAVPPEESRRGRGLENGRTEGQRDTGPANPELCSTFPQQTQRRGLLAPRPSPACGPLAAPLWEGQPGHLRLQGQRLAWARVVMVPQPLPVAQRGKKNEEPEPASRFFLCDLTTWTLQA
ncbi:uncharacterized protein LOC132221048 [Myotis daubentonii]|uniref:uncharacterized protein LOC132221048 n=1 Tax=Myotis daubentonii TaxID=98922 RepID=UPI002873AEFE|nr:uncharacterized protein LOC132221048 [Myotis daubentonii]